MDPMDVEPLSPANAPPPPLAVRGLRRSLRRRVESAPPALVRDDDEQQAMGGGDSGGASSRSTGTSSSASEGGSPPPPSHAGRRGRTFPKGVKVGVKKRRARPGMSKAAIAERNFVGRDEAHPSPARVDAFIASIERPSIVINSRKPWALYNAGRKTRVFTGQAWLRHRYEPVPPEKMEATQRAVDAVGAALADRTLHRRAMELPKEVLHRIVAESQAAFGTPSEVMNMWGRQAFRDVFIRQVDGS